MLFGLVSEMLLRQDFLEFMSGNFSKVVMPSTDPGKVNADDFNDDVWEVDDTLLNISLFAASPSSAKTHDLTRISLDGCLLEEYFRVDLRNWSGNDAKRVFVKVNLN